MVLTLKIVQLSPTKKPRAQAQDPVDTPPKKNPHSSERGFLYFEYATRRLNQSMLLLSLGQTNDIVRY